MILTDDSLHVTAAKGEWLSYSASLGTSRSYCLPYHEVEDKPSIHPNYCYVDADITIATSDNHHFRTHSLILSLASGVFATMVNLPKPELSRSTTDENPHRECDLVPVSERGEVWENLLDIVYPNRVFVAPQLLCFDKYRELCLAAEKYEMESALQVLQLLFNTAGPDRWKKHMPILMCSLACQLGWIEEAKLASTQSLSLNIKSAESQEQLKQTTIENAFRLMNLHFTRKDLLIDALHFESGEIGQGIIMAVNHSDCSTPQVEDLARWMIFRYRIGEEMERSPDGQTIDSDTFWAGKEFSRLWHLSCSSCNTVWVRKAQLRDAIVSTVHRLPKTI